MKIQIKRLQVLNIEYNQFSIFSTYVTLMFWIFINVLEKENHHYFILEIVQIVISTRLNVFCCLLVNSINYCCDHESSNFVSIVVDCEFIVNVDFSRKSFKIHIIRELIRIRMLVYAFFFRKFDRIDDRIVNYELFLVIINIVLIFIRIVTIIFVKVMRSTSRIESFVFFRQIFCYESRSNLEDMIINSVIRSSIWQESRFCLIEFEWWFDD